MSVPQLVGRKAASHAGPDGCVVELYPDTGG
jgi:hypothetical protein